MDKTFLINFFIPVHYVLHNTYNSKFIEHKWTLKYFATTEI